MATQKSRVLPEFLVLIAFCAFLFFYGLGSFGLVGADEPRYAQIAREMLARHDWVTPVLNGVAWLEKPILYYWGAMISFSIFGVHDWSARVPTAVMTSAMVLATWAFMRRFRPGSQMDSGLILASLAGVIGFSRAASTDMPLTAMFTIGMLSWYAWYEARSKFYLVPFYAFMALATLAKGPVAPFLAGLIIVVFAALRREWRVILSTLWIPGIVLYFAVAVPWFVLVQNANPQFVRVFFFEHNLARYSTDMFRHKQPFWYFVPIVLTGLLPWVVLAVTAFVRAVREYKTSSFQLFFGIWAILPVIFFSFSQSKLPGYILPVMPAFAILLGEYLWRRISESDEPKLWLIGLHALVVSALLSGSLLTVYFVLRVKPSTIAVAIAVGVGLIAATAMLAVIYRKGIRTLRTVTLVPIILGLAFVIKFASPAIDAKNSARPIANGIRTAAGPDASYSVAVFGVPRDIEYGLNFYENEPIANYDRGELPVRDHYLVAKAGSEAELRMILGSRASRVWKFPPRNLEIYRISAR